MSAWHLVNIIDHYKLSEHPVDALNAMSAAALIGIIVAGVQARTDLARRK